MNFWLIKSEPSAFSYHDLVRDGRTAWDGVRNYQARNFLRAMREGDVAVYYHSTEGLAAVGIARIAREHYQDPTTDDDRWVCATSSRTASSRSPCRLPPLNPTSAWRTLVWCGNRNFPSCRLQNKSFTFSWN